MTGVIYEHKGVLVFAPDLSIDFHLGKPNDNWLSENGGWILNADQFKLKEGTMVNADCIYGGSFLSIKEKESLFHNYWFGCNIKNII